MRLRRLYEIENELKDEINKNVNNPRVYELIYELVYRYLQKTHKVDTEEDRVGVATVAAEDLYMKIYNGGEINYWTGYIAKTIICSIKNYRRMTASEIIDTTDDSDLREGIIRMSTSNSDDVIERRLTEHDRILDILFCDSVPGIIYKIVSEVCRYNEYSEEFLQIYTSVCTFILTDGFVDEFMIDENLYSYYKFILNVVKIKLGIEMDKDFEYQSNVTSNLSQIQVETISGAL